MMSGDLELNPGLVPLREDQKEIEQILTTVNNTTFDFNDWNVVIYECSSLAAHWEQLSGFLGISFEIIDRIRGNYPCNSIGCWNEAIKQWIKQNYNTEKFGEPSWKTLLNAIAKVDKLQFKKLAEKYQHQTLTEKETDGADLTSISSRQAASEQAGRGITDSVLKPVTVKPHFTFPLLNLKNMDEDEKERLHQKLFAESESMEDKFQELFKATRMSLVQRKISTGDLLEHLDCLGSVKPLYKGSELPVLGRQLPELRKTGVDNAMSVISGYCSFFNYRIIKCIIDNLGTEQDVQNLEKYEKEFSTYAKCHVFECPSEVGEMSEIGHANMFVTLDATYDSYTVSHLYAFVSNLQRILKIPAVSIRLCRIGSGSLKLIFQLPHIIQQDIFPLSSHQEAELVCLGVVELSCGDYQFSRQETMKVRIEEPASDGDSDCANREENSASTNTCDAELASIAAGLTVEKAGRDTLSISDSALGESSVISGTTAGVTQFSEDILFDGDLDDLTVGMGHHMAADPKLHLASRKGQLQVVKQLTEEEQWNPLEKVGKYGQNALHFAARGGHLDVLRYFIEERGCSAACLDQRGRTPLHHAAANRRREVVQYLVEIQQVEPFCRDIYGSTALHTASAYGSIDIIYYLAKEMSKYLPLKDVVHDKDQEGLVPLHYASMCDCLEVIDFITTQLKCDPNTTDNKDRTFLHVASQAGHLQIVKYFTEQHHCDPSCTAMYNFTPLHFAASKGHLDIVKYFTLERHCDPLLTDDFNNTPLHHAAHEGRLEVVRFFIETLHCPLGIKGQLNRTPMNMARIQGHHHVVKYLASFSRS